MNNSNVLKVNTNAELLSYIINQSPELRENIDLPVQGQDLAPIGRIIVNNQRYKNAFLNVVNTIGLTIVKRNRWVNPWDFTKRGDLSLGQQVRELIVDIANVYDYNENFNNTERFLQNVVPNVLEYIHEVNFQKFYQTTTSDAQISMAFTREGGLLDLIEKIISSNYEGLVYDTYIVDKYMLCRRILDGTITPYYIENMATNTPRENVTAIKSVSNKMSFRSPNYNPAGLRKATSFDDQILIVNTEFEAEFTTDVLATSFFRDEADLRARLKLIDSFSEHDTNRLTEVLGNQYVPFTENELTALKTIPAVLISEEWFMDYDYLIDTDGPTKATEFYNPTNLTNNHFLHAWKVFSTSPFENACVFTSQTGSVTSVSVTPSVISTSAHSQLQFFANVETTGFVNQAVKWSIAEVGVSNDIHATIDQNGLLKIPADYTGTSITVTATSVYDNKKSGDATVTIV